MEGQFKRTQLAEDERVNEKGSEAQVAGLAARIARMRYDAIRDGRTPPTVDDLGTESLPLREEDDREAMILALRGEAAGMAKFTITEAAKSEEVGGVSAVAVTAEPIAQSTDEGELTPEEAEAILSTFEARFKANMYLHEGMDWNRVKTALEADTKAVRIINKMQAAGHEPDVYDADGEGFDIGTCSKESPMSGRNCVYDAKAAQYLRDNYPGEKFSGSAVEMAQAMGVGLMDPKKYKEVLQSKGKFDIETWSYFLTDEATRNTGLALRGFRYGSEGYVDQDYAYRHRGNRAWRGSLRVKWAA